MLNSKPSNNCAARGYKQASFSRQKYDGETFIQTDVCPQAGDAILDLGCGTGELSAYLAKMVGPEGKVIGIDPDKKRIQLAQQSHSQIKNLSFVEGSASNFPGIVSQTYDIIFSNYALHWMPDKRTVFTNMFENLRVGGKIAIQYIQHLASFELNAYKELNPENELRICQMYQCESKAKIEQYCTSAGFEIIKSCEFQDSIVFEDVESLIKWFWATTHGVFNLSLVTEERLQRYLAKYSGKDGKPCLDFRGIKEESTAFQLVAVKQAEKHP